MFEERIYFALTIGQKAGHKRGLENSLVPICVQVAWNSNNAGRSTLFLSSSSSFVCLRPALSLSVPAAIRRLWRQDLSLFSVPVWYSLTETTKIRPVPLLYPTA